jgi:hypothetical protein
MARVGSQRHKNMEPTQASVLLLLETISIGLKHVEREADHSPPTRYEVKNSLVYNPTSICPFIVSCLH